MKSARFSFGHITLLTVICSFYLYPQQNERNYLGGSFGGSDFHIRDDQASPLIFSSIGIAPTLQFIYNGEESRQYGEVSYYDHYLATSADNFHTVNRRGRARYSYLCAAAEFAILNHDVHLFVGGSVNSFLCHSDYYYLYIPPTLGRTLESWYWSTSGDVALQLEYTSGEREWISFQLYLPLVSNVSRPAYSASGDYNYIENDWKFKAFGKTKVFPINFSVNALWIYQRPLFGSLNLQLSYELFFSSYPIPRDVSMYMNNLRAGIFYCF